MGIAAEFSIGVHRVGVTTACAYHFSVLSACIRLMIETSQVHPRHGLPAWLTMFGDDIGENAAAHIELGSQAHEARLCGLDQIIENAVGDVLVKMPLVAKSPDVQLQAFKLDAGFVGDVVEIKRGEIWLAGFGAQAGEFGDFHVDMKITLGFGVGKGFQDAGRRGGHGGLGVECAKHKKAVSLRNAIIKA